MQNSELLNHLKSLLANLKHIKSEFAYNSEYAEPSTNTNEDWYWGELNGMQYTYSNAADEMEAPIDDLIEIIDKLEQTIRDNTPPIPPAPGQLALPLDEWEKPDFGDWDITKEHKPHD